MRKEKVQYEGVNNKYLGRKKGGRKTKKTMRQVDGGRGGG